jgi:hypothetical protein
MMHSLPLFWATLLGVRPAQLNLALAEISKEMALDEGWGNLLFVSVRFFLERIPSSSLCGVFGAASGLLWVIARVLRVVFLVR